MDCVGIGGFNLHPNNSQPEGTNGYQSMTGSKRDHGGPTTIEDNPEKEHTAFRVPKPEKEQWKEDADEEGISLQEYLLRRVRSGRRKWRDDTEHDLDTGMDSTSSTNDADLEERVFNNLARRDGVSVEELAELLFQDLEEEIGEALDRLQDQGDVQYQHRKGGWVKTGDE